MTRGGQSSAARSSKSRTYSRTYSSQYGSSKPMSAGERLYMQIEEAILNRMAENYIKFMINCEGKEKELFFQIYFDIVAQGVFYWFFYVFPRSRLEFDNNYKKYIFNVFAELFTGLKIAHKSQFIKDWKFVTDWKLDLGAGDVLKQSKLNCCRLTDSRPIWLVFVFYFFFWANCLFLIFWLVQRDSESSKLPMLQHKKAFARRKRTVNKNRENLNVRQKIPKKRSKLPFISLSLPPLYSETSSSILEEFLF